MVEQERSEAKGVVSRAELKIAEATKAFGFSFREKVVLDIGSSTGGFTEFALRQRAKKVIAVEKGTNQMKAPLRFDPRIELHEKTDFLTLRFGPLSARFKKLASGDSSALERKQDFLSSRTPRAGEERCPTSKDQNDQKVTRMSQLSDGAINFRAVDVVMADVSFVSLKKILAKAKELVPRRAEYLVMLKPQFEAYPDQLVNGVVKNEKIRREIVQKFEYWLMKNGFLVLKKRDNETVGKIGKNRERFYWLRNAG